MPSIGKQLQILRKEADLSQSELARRLGTSKSSINMYERNDREPGLVMLENIADFFNVDVEYLLGRQIPRRLLTIHEGKVIVAYRDQPEVQPEVDTILGIQEKAPSEDGAILSVAARGTAVTDEEFDALITEEDALESPTE